MNWLLSEVVIINEFFPSSVSISLIGREDSFIVSKSRSFKILISMVVPFFNEVLFLIDIITYTQEDGNIIPEKMAI